MKFEEYLTEDKKGNLFAIKLLSKWHEDNRLPWADTTAIMKSINGEKDDVSSISEFFHKNYRISGAKAEIIDMTASQKAAQTIEVTIKWTTINDRHKVNETKLMISEA